MFLVCGLLFATIFLYYYFRRRGATNMVFVLGDVHRSPRMINHTTAILLCFHNVTLIGKSKSHNFKLPIEFTVGTDFSFFNLAYLDMFDRLKPRWICLAVKFVIHCLYSIISLLIHSPIDALIVQNPPSVSIFIVCAILKKCGLINKYIIDWHNYGYTLIESHSPSTVMKFYIALYRWIEFNFSKYADHHLCVSRQMKEDLISKLGFVKITVFYDRPASVFKPYLGDNVVDERLRLFKTSDELSAFGHYLWKNTAIVISSSSWTDDEDLTILLTALKIYDKEVHNKALPPILCIISGRGKNREFFERQLSGLNLYNVIIKTIWLKFSDYAELLRLADIGVCLHLSSSGLDLPMKAVDMLGSGLPVCAFNYKTIGELIIDGTNGLLFETPNELCNHLISLLSDYRKNKLYNNLRQNILESKICSFEDEWIKSVKPIFTKNSL